MVGLVILDVESQNTEENNQMGEFFPHTKKHLRGNQEYKKRELLTNSRVPPG